MVAADATHDEELRALVTRYEELAASLAESQGRATADLADLATRMTEVEKLLRSVD